MTGCVKDFLGFKNLALGIFLGIDFCLHSHIPVALNLEYPPGIAVQIYIEGFERYLAYTRKNSATNTTITPNTA